MTGSRSCPVRRLQLMGARGGREVMKTAGELLVGIMGQLILYRLLVMVEYGELISARIN